MATGQMQRIITVKSLVTVNPSTMPLLHIRAGAGGPVRTTEAGQ